MLKGVKYFCNSQFFFSNDSQGLQIKLKSFTIDNYHLVCDFEFHQTRGWFTSPNFPLNYNDDANCSYRITARKGRVIILKFERFALENKANGKDVATLKIPLRDTREVLVCVKVQIIIYSWPPLRAALQPRTYNK